MQGQAWDGEAERERAHMPQPPLRTVISSSRSWRATSSVRTCRFRLLIIWQQNEEQGDDKAEKERIF